MRHINRTTAVMTMVVFFGTLAASGVFAETVTITLQQGFYGYEGGSDDMNVARGSSLVARRLSLGDALRRSHESRDPSHESRRAGTYLLKTEGIATGANYRAKVVRVRTTRFDALLQD